MDDIGKAIIMAGQVLMFTFAATISIYLYSSLTGRVNNVMLANNYSNRGDAIVDLEIPDLKRTVTKAEIVMAILDLQDKYEKTGDDSYIVEVVGTAKYQYVGFDEENDIDVNKLRITLNDGTKKYLEADEYKSYILDHVGVANYELTYNEGSNVLKYTKK